MRLCYIFCALFVHGATAAIVRKPPAFATPVYSDTYLPAVLQVTFNIVDQLKRLDAEEMDQEQLVPSTSPHPPGQKQPLPTPPTSVAEDGQTATASDAEKYYDPPERYQEEALIIARPPDVNFEKISGSQVTPEVNHEESEVVYGVPESNYEIPEANHEVPEVSEADSSQLPLPDTASTCNEFKTNPKHEPRPGEDPVVESVVKEIYSIVKTSSSGSTDVAKDVVVEPACIEAKNSMGNSAAAEKAPEDKDRTDDLKDDERFGLLGERVEQVPRPSLVAFLRASNVTSNPTLRQLGELYDAFSRDARKQGFAKFAGYSDAVLKVLKDSSGGGAGIQLKELLEKTVANKELTRYDAMLKANETIGSLNDGGSKLSTDLRRLLPLPFEL